MTTLASTVAASINIDEYCDKLAKAGTEHAEQRAFFGWLQMMVNTGAHPLAHMAFAIPNGGKRDAITAARLKAEGVKAGVPDTCYPVPRGRYAGLFIELKINGGRVSDSQREWRADLRTCGYASAVCWGWRKAAECFRAYEFGHEIAEDYK